MKIALTIDINLKKLEKALAAKGYKIERREEVRFHTVHHNHPEADIHIEQKVNIEGHWYDPPEAFVRLYGDVINESINNQIEFYESN